MHQIDLTRLDLNLLVVFEALFQERHVGRAAKRMALSQSATSHALGRLRQLFDDPLFVRNPRGVEPTVRGRELAEPIAGALAQIRSLMTPTRELVPAQLRRTFRIAVHDYAMAVAIAPLVAALRSQAPGVDLRCVSIHPEKVIDALDRGELDCALGGFHGIQAARVSRTVLFSDRFVGLARRGHPGLRNRKMSLTTFVNTPQVLIAPGGEGRGEIDEALLRIGRERRVAVTAPNFLSVPLLVAGTDLIGVLPEKLAHQLLSSLRLSVFELPVAVEPVTCSFLALAPVARQPDMAWLLDRILRVCAPD